MNNLRFEALRKIANQERSIYVPNDNRFDHFAENVLDDNKLQNYLSKSCLLYTSPSPRDLSTSRMPSSA